MKDILKGFKIFTMIYQQKFRLKNATSLFVIFIIKTIMLHIRILKQALNYGLTLEKVHKVIQFNQKNLA